MLLAGMGLIGFGFFLRRKIRSLNRMFDQIMDTPEFNLDYINSLMDLPIEKDILILGKVKPHNEKLINSKEKECVLLSYTAQPKQIEDGDSDDLMWRIETPFSLFLINEKEQSIYVENKAAQPVYAFNLRVAGEIDKSKIRESLLQRLKKFSSAGKYHERCIEVDRNLLVIGRLVRSVQQKERMMLIPKFLLGDNKQSLLKHLDATIIHTAKQCNYLIGGGLAVLLCHFAYTRISKTVQQPHLDVAEV